MLSSPTVNIQSVVSCQCWLSQKWANIRSCHFDDHSQFKSLSAVTVLCHLWVVCVNYQSVSFYYHYHCQLSIRGCQFQFPLSVVIFSCFFSVVTKSYYYQLSVSISTVSICCLNQSLLEESGKHTCQVNNPVETQNSKLSVSVGIC